MANTQALQATQHDTVHHCEHDADTSLMPIPTHSSKHDTVHPCEHDADTLLMPLPTQATQHDTVHPCEHRASQALAEATRTAPAEMGRQANADCSQAALRLDDPCPGTCTLCNTNPCMYAPAHQINDSTTCACHEPTFRGCSVPRPPPVPPPIRPVEATRAAPVAEMGRQARPSIPSNRSGSRAGDGLAGLSGSGSLTGDGYATAAAAAQ